MKFLTFRTIKRSINYHLLQWYSKLYHKENPRDPKSKGSAEAELTDEAPKFAKLRPMRVEMYCIYWD